MILLLSILIMKASAAPNPEALRVQISELGQTTTFDLRQQKDKTLLTRNKKQKSLLKVQDFQYFKKEILAARPKKSRKCFNHVKVVFQDQGKFKNYHSCLTDKDDNTKKVKRLVRSLDIMDRLHHPR